MHRGGWRSASWYVSPSPPLKNLPLTTDPADASTPHTVKKPAKKKPKPSGSDSVAISPNSLAQAKARSGSVTCEVMIGGLPHGEGLTPAAHSYIQVTDAEREGSTTTTDVQCLFCRAKID